MRAIILLVATLFSLPSFADDGVRIVSAKWGNKDVTQEASTFCNGKETCQYKVSSRFLGRPRGNKIFSISWQCQSKPLQSRSTPPNAEGTIIEIDCSVAPVAQAIPVVDKIREPIVLIKRNLSISDCSEESVVKADDSPELSYFQSLYEREDAAIEEYLQLWYPNESEEYEGAYFFSCESKQSSNNYLEGPCKHDVFYSWGPKEKLSAMKSTMKDNEQWSGVPNPGGRINYGSLFMTLTPVSTMNYGSVGVRVRLKEKTRIKIDSSWNPSLGVVSMKPYGTTYEDVVINDASSIESWSYGTPEQYDEIIRDINRIASGKKAHYYATSFHDLEARGITRVFNKIDSHPLYEKELKERLHSLIGMILNGEGRIHYQKGSCRNRSQFFATDKPSYFNPS